MILHGRVTVLLYNVPVDGLLRRVFRILVNSGRPFLRRVWLDPSPSSMNIRILPELPPKICCLLRAELSKLSRLNSERQNMASSGSVY